MTTFPIHDIESAPAASQDLLAGAKAKFGAIPNLLGAFAESPALLDAYLSLGRILAQSSAFDAIEIEVIALASSVENDCEYCVAVHSATAGSKSMAPDLVRGLRDGGRLADPKLEALATFTRIVIRDRGFVADEDVQDFFAAGFSVRLDFFFAC